MRGWGAALIVLAALAVAPAAHAGTCVIQSEDGSKIEYPCGSMDNAPADAPNDTPWYATAQFQLALTVLGLAGSGGAAFFGYTRVKKRRRTLADTVARIDDALALGRAQPLDGARRLVALRAEIKTLHEKGRMEDAQFLELDKRVRESVVRMRLLSIQRAAPDLPPDFVQHVRHLIDDGQVSAQDVVEIDEYARTYRLSLSSREEVARLMDGWSKDDAQVVMAVQR